jgi:regulator of RNase E activity RraA
VIPPVSAIADVLALWGLDGWLTPPLRTVVAPIEPVLGRVRTILVAAGSGGAGLAPVYDILGTDLSGQVLVIGGATRVQGAVWGEILATAAHRSGASGLLVHGSVRDQPEMATIGLPVFALDQCVVGPNGTAHVVDLDARILIDNAGMGGHDASPGTVIDPDDHVVADATGCVRIHAAALTDVLDAATRYAAAETFVVEALRNGEPLVEAYLLKKTTVDELRR